MIRTISQLLLNILTAAVINIQRQVVMRPVTDMDTDILAHSPPLNHMILSQSDIPAGNESAVFVFQRWDFPSAPVRSIDTSRMEMASGRRICRIGHFPFENDPVDGDIRIRLRNSGKQRLCIWVQRLFEQIICFAEFDHPSKVHDHHPVGYVTDHA